MLNCKSPSPDRSENPFVPAFGTKDWNDSRNQLPIKKMPQNPKVSQHFQTNQ
jgi:hypothetical protein